MPFVASLVHVSPPSTFRPDRAPAGRALEAKTHLAMVDADRQQRLGGGVGIKEHLLNWSGDRAADDGETW